MSRCVFIFVASLCKSSGASEREVERGRKREKERAREWGRKRDKRVSAVCGAGKVYVVHLVSA